VVKIAHGYTSNTANMAEIQVK